MRTLCVSPMNDARPQRCAAAAKAKVLAEEGAVWSPYLHNSTV